MAVFEEMIAAAQHRCMINPFASFDLCVSVFPEVVCKARLPIAKLQVSRFEIEIAQCVDKAVTEILILDDRAFCKGKGAMMVTSRDHPFRRQIQHPVVQTFLCAGAAIMNLVRMQDNDVAGCTEARRPTIGKGLNTGNRHTQRVGVVTMRRVCVAMEPGIDALDPFAGRRTNNALETARTFKIGIVLRF